MSFSRRKSPELPNANTNADVHDASKSGIYYNNGNGLRRRYSKPVNHQEGPPIEAEKKHEGETNTGPHKIPHGIPKRLTPFFHINDTNPTQLPVAGYLTPPRSQSPNAGMDGAPVSPLPDIEGQHLQVKKNPRHDFDEDVSFNFTSLATDSGTDSLNNSVLSSIDIDSGDTDEDVNTIDTKGKKSGTHGINDGGDKSYSNHSDIHSDNDLSIGSDQNEPTNSNLHYVIEKIQSSRRFCGKLINNTPVMLTIIFLILINALLMGVSTTKWVYLNPQIRDIFERLDLAFLWIFSVEVVMQLYYYGPAFFLDSWLVFDFMVVGLCWVTSIAMTEDESDLQVLRSFRIFRAFRLVTRVKPLRDLVLALGDVLPRMAAIMCLLVIIFYIFAVLFTELFGRFECLDDGNSCHLKAQDETNYFLYFESLHMSGFACFQMMTMEWAEICRGIMYQTGNDYFQLLFYLFVMIAGFIVFNLIVAVVVEAVATTEETIRALDGIEDNSPKAKLEEAQERIDLLQSHLNEMMNQQEQIQCMLEAMAGELLHLETERMKAVYRENVLRKRMNRRVKYQKQFESANVASSRELIGGNSLNADSLHDSVTSEGRMKKAKPVWTARPSLTKDGSGKSVGTDRSKDSTSSGSPRRDERKSRTSIKKKSIMNWTVRPGGMKKEGSGKSLGTHKSYESMLSEYNSSNDDTNSAHFKRPSRIESKSRSKSTGHYDRDSEHKKKKRARDNWKKMLAVPSTGI
uniref:Ion transport domain-containing protein n=1 Tax=Pseudo-nitzschia australis TaxID=44445 RepID=A0A7S4AAP2_9STRA|mmetsp:Transcript_6698/g.14257  ORF Transcript_6698/g.14257 Transcript_6698/m.14257 type:complete len:741 (-) Transcript_6698:476-2698(-)|eukprot:CAMPEP_0168308052 /NCGR_PEP_ID=MMETSP0142_2-20121227/60142_1 /TAXON_ID=44445 /ORGANISM="Pseudo-nitzschia australis, Strain 10249 10 AB" /LENGTH=740 /DNA_ID=CAMNT_0008260311 /DNA_START=414 /DNA_END=2636 /DNA_ORIENTATION=-